jgi:hypothetical protein
MIKSINRTSAIHIQLLEKTSPIRNLVKSTEDNKVLNLKSESAERIEGLREFQQSIDLLKKDEKYLAEPLIGLSSNMEEAVLEEAGGL